MLLGLADQAKADLMGRVVADLGKARDLAVPVAVTERVESVEIFPLATSVPSDLDN